MSYILDALKKSEQERQRGKVPDLRSGPDNNTPPPQKRGILVLVLIGIAVLNLGALIWFFSRDDAPEPAVAVEDETQSRPLNQVADPAPQQAGNTAAPAVQYLRNLEELPPQERQAIPQMTFSSHMYSSMPKFRSIIINGRRLKEGQYFNQDTQVTEITESGVIMSYQGTPFEVDVLGQWAQ